MRVNRKAAARVASGHPWIFSSDVLDRGDASPGDAVLVVDAAGGLLGTAHYSSTSLISLRMLSPRPETVDKEFLFGRLKSSHDHRRMVAPDTDAYRAVYAEADQLPGLIVDRYGDCLVMQTLDQGMDLQIAVIAECLVRMFAPRVIVARNDAAVRSREGLPLETRILHGEVPADIRVTMNGLSFQVDLIGGQKTGIFLDQRENYLAAARWARGKALDCFTCTGGFALHLASRCETVEAVDSSAASLRAAASNAQANGISNIHFLEANAFDLLAGHAAAGRRFRTIVLDPPAFAKSRSAVEGALRGYREINLRALKLLEPGGVMVTCSCSHHVSEAMLLEVVAQASLDANRTVRVLERRTQALDHPILLTVPETHYLKCLVLQVI